MLYKQKMNSSTKAYNLVTNSQYFVCCSNYVQCIYFKVVL